MRSLRVLLLLAPVIFIVHVAEEMPTFVAWFNAHVDRGITRDTFMMVNGAGLAVTLAVVAAEWLVHTTISAAIAVAWLALLFGANGLFHIVAAIVDRGYVPGLVSAIVLYLPYFAWFLWRLGHKQRLPVPTIAAAAILGALPMLVHGYLIVFRRSRLF